MKKLLSILLSIIALFSLSTVLACSPDPTIEPPPITTPGDSDDGDNDGGDNDQDGDQDNQDENAGDDDSQGGETEGGNQEDSGESQSPIVPPQTPTTTPEEESAGWSPWVPQ